MHKLKTDKSECKECHQVKVKISTINPDAASFNNRFSYLDELGRRWYGRQCPDCTKHFNAKKAKLAKVIPISTHKKFRSCTKCGYRLPKDRWFIHPECAAGLEVSDEYENLVYL